MKIPAQLSLLDPECARLLAKLLVPPNSNHRDLDELYVAERVLALVARLNSREALRACVLCALVAGDDCSLERGAKIERSIVALHSLIAQVKREPAPKVPKWLRALEEFLAQDKEDEEIAEVNAREAAGRRGEDEDDVSAKVDSAGAGH